jgi:hypothetical protein
MSTLSRSARPVHFTASRMFKPLPSDKPNAAAVAPPISRLPRALWVTLQAGSILPFMWAAVVVIEMTFAMPGQGYRTESGNYVVCEALAARGKPYTAPRCATYGSKETNPTGYTASVALLCALSAILWATTRPGRGLRFSRRQG